MIRGRRNWDYVFQPEQIEIDPRAWFWGGDHDLEGQRRIQQQISEPQRFRVVYGDPNRPEVQEVVPISPPEIGEIWDEATQQYVLDPTYVDPTTRAGRELVERIERELEESVSSSSDEEWIGFQAYFDAHRPPPPPPT
jgi:hypothetical protein